MKYRIIETEDGLFVPQFREGLFRTWKFFRTDALDRMRGGVMLVGLLQERDPSRPAGFEAISGARDFVRTVDRVADRYWEHRDAIAVRATEGKTVKAIHEVKGEG